MTDVPKTVTEIWIGRTTETRRQDNRMARAGVRRSFLEEVMSKLNLNMKRVCKTHIGRKKFSAERNNNTNKNRGH